jgi:hypothetical protein
MMHAFQPHHRGPHSDSTHMHAGTTEPGRCAGARAVRLKARPYTIMHAHHAPSRAFALRGTEDATDATLTQYAAACWCWKCSACWNTQICYKILHM